MTIIPQHLVKRDGSVKSFDASKITAALVKAGRATGEFDEKEAEKLTRERVMPKLEALNCARPTLRGCRMPLSTPFLRQGTL